MRYRALDANGDYTIGQGSANFLINSPACVAQSVRTRLNLWLGQWFLDQTVGMPWLTDVIGKNTGPLYDVAVQQYILATQGVSQIQGYSSSLNRVTRKLTINITNLITIYGATPFTATVGGG
jgi:hypothetical protein